MTAEFRAAALRRTPVSATTNIGTWKTMVDLTEDFLREYEAFKEEVLRLRESSQQTEQLQALAVEFAQLQTAHAQLAAELDSAREDVRNSQRRADEQAAERDQKERQLAEARKLAADRLTEIERLTSQQPPPAPPEIQHAATDERSAKHIEELKKQIDRLEDDVVSLTGERNWLESKLQDRGRPPSS